MSATATVAAGTGLLRLAGTAPSCLASVEVSEHVAAGARGSVDRPRRGTADDLERATSGPR